MEHNKNTTSGVGYRITTPIFPDCERMTVFYAHAHEIIRENFAKLRAERGGGILTADYTLEEEGDTVKITVKQRMRVCGRLVGESEVTHLWRGGMIAKESSRGGWRIKKRFLNKASSSFDAADAVHHSI